MQVLIGHRHFCKDSEVLILSKSASMYFNIFFSWIFVREPILTSTSDSHILIIDTGHAVGA